MNDVNKANNQQGNNDLVKRIVDLTQNDDWKIVADYGHSVRLTNGQSRLYYCPRVYTSPFFPSYTQWSSLKDNLCLFCVGAHYDRYVEEICDVIILLSRMNNVNERLKKITQIVTYWETEQFIVLR